MKTFEVLYDVEQIVDYLKREIKQSCGLKMLELLVMHHDEAIDVTRLRHLESPASIHAKEFDVKGGSLTSGISTNHSIPELPILAADKKAIEQVKKDMIRLLTKERHAMINNDYAKAADYRERREKCEEYLSKAVSKQGKIRYLQYKRHKDYIVIKNNVRSFLDKVRLIKPEYAEYIDAHLVIGHECVWKSE